MASRLSLLSEAETVESEPMRTLEELVEDLEEVEKLEELEESNVAVCCHRTYRKTRRGKGETAPCIPHLHPQIHLRPSSTPQRLYATLESYPKRTHPNRLATLCVYLC